MRDRPSPLLIDHCGACMLARQVLSLPPALPRIERPAPVGDLVAVFALPLDLLPPSNRTRGGQAWRLGQIKRDCERALRYQSNRQWADEFTPKRPQFRCLRLSTQEPDKYNDGFKIAVDRLVALGFAEDDAPAFLDLHQWWEPLPAGVPFGAGFGYIEVRTGAK